GDTIDVSVASSSEISEFTLDEASKKISFRADGSGSTTVAVGAVLESPYTVMVDGQEAEFDETTEGGVSSISVEHESGAEIAITGTQVVPEFPVAVLGVVAALIGIITVLGRTRLMKGRI
ncbi:MAG: hypothetical protein MN733_00520, partial [Nitrososphaera sp.]|nr:hypothetical protein [Nitrososphaera sp.]